VPEQRIIESDRDAFSELKGQELKGLFAVIDRSQAQLTFEP
jgi:hypothetical protein